MTHQTTPHRRARRLCAAALAIGAAATASACGGDDRKDPNPPTASGGAQIFEEAGCANCHTLAAAGSAGKIGPDLDDLRPSFGLVERQVERGGGGMPAYDDQLSRTQIRAVARYVADATGGDRR